MTAKDGAKKGARQLLHLVHLHRLLDPEHDSKPGAE
jgi:hypothetical protein